MGAIDQSRVNQLIDAMFGVTPFPATTTPIHCRLMTANGSATVNGTELASGGGYTSGVGAPTFTMGVASGGGSVSSSTVTITNMPNCSLYGIEVWDSSPRRLTWGAITNAPKTINTGDTVTIVASGIALSFP